MKHFQIILFAGLFLLGACKKHDRCYPGTLEPEYETYTLIENAAFEFSIDTFSYFIDTVLINDTTYHYLTVDGNKIIASYMYSAEQCTNAIDDEYAYEIEFEIDPAVSSFSISGDSLKSVHCHFSQYGYIFGYGAHPVSTGYINGTKVNNQEWYIEFEITPDPIFFGEQVESYAQSGYYRL